MMGVSHSGGRLPAEYQEVEWIKSDGQAYINTGYIGGDTTFELHFTTDDNVLTDQCLIGCRTDNNRYYVLSVERFFYIARVGFEYSNITALPNTDYVCVAYTQDNTNYLDVNGTVWGSACPKAPRNPLSLYLFANNRDGIALTFFKGKISFAKIGDALSFVPCYRKSDNVAGMYDTVSNTFFTNAASTGSFTVGPDVL